MKPIGHAIECKGQPVSFDQAQRPVSIKNKQINSKKYDNLDSRQ